MVAISSFVSLSLIIMTGTQQVVSQSCNELKFVDIANSGTCPEEGNFAMPGDCQSYIKCFCQVGIMENFLAICPKGELFIDGKCVKETDQSCPQANCTEAEVFAGEPKTYTHNCPMPETTTEEPTSTTEESAGKPAEKSAFESVSSATTITAGLSVICLLVTLGINFSTSS